MESQDSGTLLIASPESSLAAGRSPRTPCVEHGNDTKVKSIRDIMEERGDGSLATNGETKLL